MDKALVRERIQHQKCPYCGAERERSSITGMLK